MAYHKSAAKRARQNDKKNAVNHSYVSSVRSAVKGFKKLIDDITTGVEKDLSKVEPLFVQAQSKIMKAASKGLLHKNNAARSVARLALLLKKSAGAASAAAAAKSTKDVAAAKKKATKAAAAGATKKTTTKKAKA